MAKNELFRKESVDRISSPEQMRDYLRVTSPRLWMLLGVIILLLGGFIIYAATSRVESVYALKMQLNSPEYLYAEIPYAQMDQFTIGMPLRVGGEAGSIQSIYSSSRIRLNISFDSGTEPADDYYYLTLGEGTDVDLESAHFLTCQDGLWTSSEPDIQKNFQGGDMRGRIWTVEWTGTEINLIDGRLVTISGAEPYTMTMVEASLDNPEADLEPGVYDAEIITESTTPLSFLLN